MTLLDALLTGGTPHTLFARAPRAENGTYPREFLVREDGCVADATLDQIRTIAVADARAWLHDELATAWRGLTRWSSVLVQDGADRLGKPARKVRVWTSGHAGCEAVIRVILEHTSMHEYLEAFVAPGTYVFVVPHE